VRGGRKDARCAVAVKRVRVGRQRWIACAGGERKMRDAAMVAKIVRGSLLAGHECAGDA
jgi:hypothetical protein